MRAQAGAFKALDLRCHMLLHDVELRDVWAIPLADGGSGRTMRDVFAVSPLRHPPASAPVRYLFALRWAVGRVLGWDRDGAASPAGSYVERLTDEDRSRSLVAPGTREGNFRVVYMFNDESLLEIRNATVHGFLVSALLVHPGGYLLYWAIYVKPIGPLTPLYMGAIEPFRRLIVYPALTRQMQSAWTRAYS